MCVYTHECMHIYLKPYGSCRPPHVEDVCDFQHWEVVMGKSRVRTTIFVEQKTKPNTAVSHEGVLFYRHGLLTKMSPRTFEKHNCRDGQASAAKGSNACHGKTAT